MADPIEVDLPFPLRGVDVSRSLTYQPGGTTPEGENVRAADPTTGRLRGGSRPGLSKYNPSQTAEGSELIQHLNVVVSVSGEGIALPGYDYLDPLTGIIGGAEPGNPGEPDPSTNTEYIDDGGDPNLDPDDPLIRNPNRVVRRGGSGVPPTRHRVPFHPPDANLYVGTVLSGSGGTYSARLDSGATASVTLVGADPAAGLEPGTVLTAVKVGGVYYAQVGLWGA